MKTPLTIRCRDRVLTCPGRPLLMGIVNVTPDSFSDGGEHDDCFAAVRHGLELVAGGAEILDIGGESTRPGAPAVPPEVEIERVAPVIAELKRQVPRVTLSVDTRKAAVARAALEAGADLVNDVSGLTYDPGLAEVAAEYRAGLVLMHMRGTPATMQSPELLRYDDLFGEVALFLQRATGQAVAAGVDPGMVIWDPGIGFAKALSGNLELLGRIGELRDLGYPLLVGPSRKAFIGRLTGQDDPRQRVAGTIGAACWLAAAGVEILRVHDVAAVREALTVFTACRNGGHN